jgi:hypothetical protein
VDLGGRSTHPPEKPESWGASSVLYGRFASKVAGASEGLSPTWRSTRTGLGSLRRLTRTANRGDQSKPTLHLVELAGVGGLVVHVEAWPLRQPGLDLGVLLDAVIIVDQLQVKLLVYHLVDPSQEADETLLPVP